MPEAQENSVLTSLKELRRQEEERVKQEKAKAEAKADADRRAKEEAERARLKKQKLAIKDRIHLLLSRVSAEQPSG